MNREGYHHNISLQLDLFQTVKWCQSMQKCFKALIDSGSAISLMHTSVYNKIEDHF